jgi:hypothetical protein
MLEGEALLPTEYYDSTNIGLPPSDYFGHGFLAILTKISQAFSAIWLTRQALQLIKVNIDLPLSWRVLPFISELAFVRSGWLEEFLGFARAQRLNG